MDILNIPEMLIAILSLDPKGIKGRTALQKLGYFCSVKLGKEAGYGPDFYGPYSTMVSSSIQDLVGIEFISESKRWTQNQRLMYTYSLTDDGEQLVEDIKQNNPELYSMILEVVEKCKTAVNNNIYTLSWAAKVHFILCQTKKPITYEKAIEIGKKFGWKLDQPKIESAVQLLKTLELIVADN